MWGIILHTKMASTEPKISVGLFLYNEENFIRKKLDSVLSQTFSDFELIISDNGSTDSTPKICEEYAKKDKRIRYFRQDKNMGSTWNLKFVLQKARCKYFIWAAADDILLPTFLEKNYQVLESKRGVVASISKISSFEVTDNIKIDSIDNKFKNFIKKSRNATRPRSTYSLSGTYETKVRKYLKRSSCQVFYSLFRTDILRKSIIEEEFIGYDWAVFLNVLKHGDLHVVDEVLMHQFEGGSSVRGIIGTVRHYERAGLLGILFPWNPLITWVRRHLGIKIFLKNLDYFIQLNIEGGVSLLIDLVRRSTHLRAGK